MMVVRRARSSGTGCRLPVCITGPTTDEAVLGLTSGPAGSVAVSRLARCAAAHQSDPRLADWTLSKVEEDEDEETLERVEDAEQDVHRGGGTTDGEQRERPRQTCSVLQRNTVDRVEIIK